MASVGAALRSVVRGADFAGRNDGEEFAVLLPDTDIAAALKITERVRATIAEVSSAGRRRAGHGLRRRRCLPVTRRSP